MKTHTTIHTSTSFVLGVILLLASLLLVLKLWVKLTTGWCRSNACLVGKTAIITGANAGIGYETAEDFAKRGAKVILACRDLQRGKDAEERIREATGNKNVFFKQMDLASLKSVRKFAEDVINSENRLDILVNNAGVGFLGPDKTEDGLLVVMQINHFAHFLLTNLLLDLIKSTPKSRIVNVASIGASAARYFDPKHLNAFPQYGFSKHLALYARSKLCNVLFTMELAKRLKDTNVTTYSVHPGAVYTEIFRRMPMFTRFMWEQTIRCFFKNSMEGAQTTIHCSVSQGIEQFSGQHFHDCHVVKTYKTARDPNLPTQLWTASEDYIKLNKKTE